MAPRTRKSTHATSSPPSSSQLPTSLSSTQNCHYTIQNYVCRHTTWSGNYQRIIHEKPCPFAPAHCLKAASKRDDLHRIRCANMEKEPRSVDVPEDCPKCRPYTLGIPGKSMRGGESEAEAEGEGEVLEGGVGGSRDRRDGKIAEETAREKTENTPPTNTGEGGGIADCESGVNSRWMKFGHSSVPSAANGDAAVQVSTFSVFKRVLGGLIPGSGNDERSEGEEEGKGGNEEEAKAKGGKNVKQSWVDVEEEPDWEVIGRETK